MYIKLTRLDNSPIWINASFIVTIEPRKGGGAVVVPIGDGLDYDVRESAETVLAMLGDAPAPTVVPVPAPRGLAPTPEDVSPETPAADAPAAAAAEPAAATAEPAAAKPAKKATRKSRAKAAPSEPPAAEAASVTVLTDEQIDRLRKLAPKSVKKFANTLTSQFKISDADATIKDLSARGLLMIDGTRLIWKSNPS